MIIKFRNIIVLFFFILPFIYGQSHTSVRTEFVKGLPDIDIEEFNHLLRDVYLTASIQGVSLNETFYVTAYYKLNEEPGIWLIRVNRDRTYKIENINFEISNNEFKFFEVPLKEDDKVVKCKISCFDEKYILEYNIEKKSYKLWNASLIMECSGIDGTKTNGGGRGLVFHPFSFYFNGAIIINGNYLLEIRPGYFMGGPYFKSLECGLYLTRSIYESFFSSIGILVRYTDGLAHGVEVYESVEEGFYPAYAFSIGVDISEDFSVLLMYNKNIVEKYGYRVYTVDSMGPELFEIRKENIYMYSVIKLGVMIDI